MKTALYTENGFTQLVLTPENEWENLVTKEMVNGALLSVRRGSFYECQGGYFRQGNDDKSLMLSIKKPDPDVTTESS